MTHSSRPPRRPTGSDVARVAGVSKSAVSRAYTGGVVSKRARQRIEAAAAQLKYRPSHTARSLTTSRSHLIGVAVTCLDNQFYPDVVQLLSDHLARLGYRILLFTTHGEETLDPVLDELLSFGVDAVVFASSSRTARVALECEAAGVPVVMFNSVDPEARVKNIAAANDVGARSVAQFLVAGGHRRFGVITGVPESTTSSERADSFAQQVRGAGFDAPRIIQGHYTFAGAEQATRGLLGGTDPVDAIFCTNDHMALAALQTARDGLGRAIGRELSIVGFDNVTIAEWSSLGLTTYSQPLQRMIDRTVQYLVNALTHGVRDESAEVFEGELIIRSSARVPDTGVCLNARGSLVWQGHPAGTPHAARR